jgi:hypothetical protein
VELARLMLTYDPELPIISAYERWHRASSSAHLESFSERLAQVVVDEYPKTSIWNI